MKFDELPPILTGAQALEWILSRDAEATRLAAVRGADGWAGGWLEEMRTRHGMLRLEPDNSIRLGDDKQVYIGNEKEVYGPPDPFYGAGARNRANRDRITDALNCLRDAFVCGAVRARAGGRDIEISEWGALGMTDGTANSLIVRGADEIPCDISGKMISVYCDDLLKLWPPTQHGPPAPSCDTASPPHANGEAPEIVDFAAFSQGRASEALTTAQITPAAAAIVDGGTFTAITDPAVWIILEIGRRRGNNPPEPTGRESMSIALGVDFPELDKYARRDVIKGIPQSLKGKGGRKKGKASRQKLG